MSTGLVPCLDHVLVLVIVVAGTGTHRLEAWVAFGHGCAYNGMAGGGRGLQKRI